MATINYNGMELEEFTSDKPVIFDPPKKCIVWMNNLNCNCVELGTAWIHDVVAYLPRKSCKVFTVNDMFEHCAIIPEKPAPRRATNIELTKWLARGNGMVKNNNNTIFASMGGYNLEKLNNTCAEWVKVRKWDDTEWHAPDVEYMGITEVKTYEDVVKREG